MHKHKHMTNRGFGHASMLPIVAMCGMRYGAGLNQKEFDHLGI